MMWYTIFCPFQQSQKIFAEMVPLVEDVVKWCILNHKEDEASLAFEMFDDIFEMVLSQVDIY